MSKTILITRPSYDSTTRYISSWAEKVIQVAKSKGNSVIDLYKNRANKKETIGVIQKKNPTLIFLNGHGNDEIVTGHEGEVLIGVGVNEAILKSKIIYALSCRSAKVLGPSSIQHGAEVYIGYDEDFIFMYSVDKINHPLEDTTARLFLEPSNQVGISLLKGHTAQSSHENSKKFFMRNIQRLLTSQASKEDSAAVRYLLWDMQHQVCMGNGGARFT